MATDRPVADEAAAQHQNTATRLPSGGVSAAFAALGGAVGNRGMTALATTAAPPVQRDLAADTRGILRRPLTRDTAQMLLAFMYTADRVALEHACAVVTADQWNQILALVPDGLSPAEGSARIVWCRSHDATVFPMIGRIPTGNQTSFATWLGEPGRRALSATIRHDMVTDDQRRLAIKSLFDATPDSEMTTLLNFFTARFRVRPQGGGDSPEPFTAAGVRRLYNVFVSLPEGAVADNAASFTSLDRERGGSGSGYYVDDTAAANFGAVVVSYARLTERWNVNDARAGHESGGLSMGVNNALTGQNVFDSVVRHEVGHAVDNRLGLNATYCVGASKAQGGAWLSMATGTVAQTMVAASGGPISNLPANQQTAVVGAMQRCVNDRRPDRIVSRVRNALRPLLPPAGRSAALDAVCADQAIEALKICFADKTPGNPWYRSADDGGITLGNRIYQEAYAGDWWSYAAAARGHKVSQYQFRSPFEWIAEAYNAYYAPPRRGEVLNARDATTKTWFDTHVHRATGGITGVREKAPPNPNTGPGFQP